MPLPYQRSRSNAIADFTVIRTMDGGADYQVHVAVTYGGCPAKTYGPPERCYPGEGPEWHVTRIAGEVYVYTPDGPEQRWLAIEATHSSEQISAVRSWAENLDLSEEAAEATTDQHELYREAEADCRRDPLE